jgi:hypothetical protein
VIVRKASARARIVLTLPALKATARRAIVPIVIVRGPTAAITPTTARATTARRATVRAVIVPRVIARTVTVPRATVLRANARWDLVRPGRAAASAVEAAAVAAAARPEPQALSN